MGTRKVFLHSTYPICDGKSGFFLLFLYFHLTLPLLSQNNFWESFKSIGMNKTGRITFEIHFATEMQMANVKNLRVLLIKKSKARSSYTLFPQVAEQTGCHGDLLEDDLAPCLRNKPLAELLAVRLDPPRFLPGFAPFVDGTVIVNPSVSFH